MTAIDTNVLVRIITNDDHERAVRATAFLARQEAVLIAKTVVLELEWVLRSLYRIDRHVIASALRSALGMANAEVEDEATVIQALEWYEQGMDFADGLHLATAGRECEFATFDTAMRRTAVRLGVGKFATI